MRFPPTVRYKAILPALLAALAAACGGDVPSVGGSDYAPAYDYAEFMAVTDAAPFQAIVSGDPFPAIGAAAFRERLLPVIQASRPRTNMVFTYAVPAERPRPWYRMVLVFDAALDLTAARVCAGQVFHRPPAATAAASVPPSRADAATLVEIFAVYCRNDEALSQTTGRTLATAPEDPRLQQLLTPLMLTLFTDRLMWRFRPFLGRRF